MRPHLTIPQRLVMRYMGVKISDDGLRWTASRKRRDLVERAFEKVAVDSWRDGRDLRVRHVPGGIDLVGPKDRMSLRWRP